MSRKRKQTPDIRSLELTTLQDSSKDTSRPVQPPELLKQHSSGGPSKLLSKAALHVVAKQQQAQDHARSVQRLASLADDKEPFDVSKFSEKIDGDNVSLEKLIIAALNDLYSRRTRILASDKVIIALFNTAERRQVVFVQSKSIISYLITIMEEPSASHGHLLTEVCGFLLLYSHRDEALPIALLNSFLTDIAHVSQRTWTNSYIMAPIILIIFRCVGTIGLTLEDVVLGETPSSSTSSSGESNRGDEEELSCLTKAAISTCDSSVSKTRWSSVELQVKIDAALATLDEHQKIGRQQRHGPIAASESSFLSFKLMTFSLGLPCYRAAALKRMDAPLADKSAPLCARMITVLVEQLCNQATSATAHQEFIKWLTKSKRLSMVSDGACLAIATRAHGVQITPPTLRVVIEALVNQSTAVLQQLIHGLFSNSHPPTVAACVVLIILRNCSTATYNVLVDAFVKTLHELLVSLSGVPLVELHRFVRFVHRDICLTSPSGHGVNAAIPSAMQAKQPAHKLLARRFVLDTTTQLLTMVKTIRGTVDMNEALEATVYDLTAHAQLVALASAVQQISRYLHQQQQQNQAYVLLEAFSVIDDTLQLCAKLQETALDLIYSRTTAEESKTCGPELSKVLFLPPCTYQQPLTLQNVPLNVHMYQMPGKDPWPMDWSLLTLPDDFQFSLPITGLLPTVRNTLLCVVLLGISGKSPPAMLDMSTSLVLRHLRYDTWCTLVQSPSQSSALSTAQNSAPAWLPDLADPSFVKGLVYKALVAAPPIRCYRYYRIMQTAMCALDATRWALAVWKQADVDAGDDRDREFCVSVKWTMQCAILRRAEWPPASSSASERRLYARRPDEALVNDVDGMETFIAANDVRTALRRSVGGEAAIVASRLIESRTTKPSTGDTVGTGGEQSLNYFLQEMLADVRKQQMLSDDAEDSGQESLSLTENCDWLWTLIAQKRPALSVLPLDVLLKLLLDSYACVTRPRSARGIGGSAGSVALFTAVMRGQSPTPILAGPVLQGRALLLMDLQDTFIAANNRLANNNTKEGRDVIRKEENECDDDKWRCREIAEECFRTLFDAVCAASSIGNAETALKCLTELSIDPKQANNGLSESTTLHQAMKNFLQRFTALFNSDCCIPIKDVDLEATLSNLHKYSLNDWALLTLASRLSAMATVHFSESSSNNFFSDGLMTIELLLSTSSTSSLKVAAVERLFVELLQRRDRRCLQAILSSQKTTSTTRGAAEDELTILKRLFVEHLDVFQAHPVKRKLHRSLNQTLQSLSTSDNTDVTEKPANKLLADDAFSSKHAKLSTLVAANIESLFVGESSDDVDMDIAVDDCGKDVLNPQLISPVDHLNKLNITSARKSNDRITTDFDGDEGEISAVVRTGAAAETSAQTVKLLTTLLTVRHSRASVNAADAAHKLLVAQCRMQSTTSDNNKIDVALALRMLSRMTRGRFSTGSQQPTGGGASTGSAGGGNNSPLGRPSLAMMHNTHQLRLLRMILSLVAVLPLAQGDNGKQQSDELNLLLECMLDLIEDYCQLHVLPAPGSNAPYNTPPKGPLDSFWAVIREAYDAFVVLDSSGAAAKMKTRANALFLKLVDVQTPSVVGVWTQTAMRTANNNNIASTANNTAAVTTTDGSTSTLSATTCSRRLTPQQREYILRVGHHLRTSVDELQAGDVLKEIEDVIESDSTLRLPVRALTHLRDDILSVRTRFFSLDSVASFGSAGGGVSNGDDRILQISDDLLGKLAATSPHEAAAIAKELLFGPDAGNQHRRQQPQRGGGQSNNTSVEEHRDRRLLTTLCGIALPKTARAIVARAFSERRHQSPLADVNPTAATDSNNRTMQLQQQDWPTAILAARDLLNPRSNSITTTR